jgi:threonine dehydrogenase-like Zn-dependent dehydrogenase
MISTATIASFIQREPELLGQTVVVIGGSAGIGLETARQARAEGAKVILTDRNPQRLQRAASELDAVSTAAFVQRSRGNGLFGGVTSPFSRHPESACIRSALWAGAAVVVDRGLRLLKFIRFSLILTVAKRCRLFRYSSQNRAQHCHDKHVSS